MYESYKNQQFFTDDLNKFDNKSEILMQSRYKVNETFGQNQNYQDQES